MSSRDDLATVLEMMNTATRRELDQLHVEGIRAAMGFDKPVPSIRMIMLRHEEQVDRVAWEAMTPSEISSKLFPLWDVFVEILAKAANSKQLDANQRAALTEAISHSHELHSALARVNK